MIEFKNVNFAYEDKKILQDISFSINQGEVVSILGESGSGKTTLFNLAAGLLVPNEGEVLLKEEAVTLGSVGYMLQKDLLLPFKTVEMNLALPLILKGISKDKAIEEVKLHLDEFGLMGTEKKYPHQLSGGMRQRAALLRTYLFSEDVVLLDEPFSALDPLTRRKMHAWYLNVMQRIEKTTLLITHDVDEAIYLSDVIYVLRGSPASLSEPIAVTYPRPRTYDMLLEKDFLVLKKKVMNLL